jgi:transcription factor SOX7/8/10/18 (SOX group E/F)
MLPGQSWPQPTEPAPALEGDEDNDSSHRPPNAFILYSQAARSGVRQENPTLSNTEVSRLLGKMWKEVPSEVKLQYKQKAAIAQEQFKRDHPNYTYRKARRKRALNELLTKSAQLPFQMPGFTGEPNLQAMMAAGNPYWPMYGQAQGANPAAGAPGQGAQPPQGYPGYPGNPAQPGLYQYQGK